MPGLELGGEKERKGIFMLGVVGLGRQSKRKGDVSGLGGMELDGFRDPLEKKKGVGMKESRMVRG